MKNLEQLKQEEYFILLNDFPKFKNEAQIAEIEKIMEQFREYDVKERIVNKLNFKEIEHDDIINFKDASILEFFKSLNFILSENSKMRLFLLYFCIKNGFHILIPWQTGTGKTNLFEAVCILLKKNMIKYNCSENTKFPNLKFAFQLYKNKFTRIE